MQAIRQAQVMWSGCAHSRMLFSFQAFIPACLLCYILLEQLSFPKVTVFTHICSYR